MWSNWSYFRRNIVPVNKNEALTLIKIVVWSDEISRNRALPQYSHTMPRDHGFPSFVLQLINTQGNHNRIEQSKGFDKGAPFYWCIFSDIFVRLCWKHIFRKESQLPKRRVFLTDSRRKMSKNMHQNKRAPHADKNNREKAKFLLCSCSGTDSTDKITANDVFSQTAG
jgi:hypothetical protein